MKKLSFFIVLLFTFSFASAQITNSTVSESGGINGNNELKLNLAYTIAGFPELNYERILKDDMSIGLAVMIGVEDNSEYKFGFIPNYRIYFGNKKANGFFIEGNAAVISTDYDSYFYNYTTNVATHLNDAQINFGLGAAAGAKFLTANGFVGEIYLGAGRLFGDNADAFPRGGITIGKRF